MESTIVMASKLTQHIHLLPALLGKLAHHLAELIIIALRHLIVLQICFQILNSRVH